MWNAGLDEAQAGIKIARRNMNNLRYYTYDRKWRGTKESLDESERGEWKSWLKTKHVDIRQNQYDTVKFKNKIK